MYYSTANYLILFSFKFHTCTHLHAPFQGFSPKLNCGKTDTQNTWKTEQRRDTFSASLNTAQTEIVVWVPCGLASFYVPNSTEFKYFTSH